MKNKCLLIFLIIIINFISCSKYSNEEDLEIKYYVEASEIKLEKPVSLVTECENLFIGKSLNGLEFKLFSKNGSLIKNSKYKFLKGKGPFEVMEPPLVIGVNQNNKELYLWASKLNKFIILNFKNNKIINKEEIYYNVKGNGGGSVYVDSNKNIYVVNVFSNYRIMKYDKNGKILKKFIPIDYSEKQDMKAMVNNLYGLSVINDYFILYGYMNGKLKFYKRESGTLKLINDKYSYDIINNKEIKITDIKKQLKNIIAGKKIKDYFCVTILNKNKKNNNIVREIFSSSGESLYYQIIKIPKNQTAVNIVQSVHDMSKIYYQEKEDKNINYKKIIIAKRK